MKLIHQISALIFSTVSSAAFSLDYKCQLASAPQFYLRSVTWDGSTPFETPLMFDGKSGVLRVKPIGMQGHPDYLFQIIIGERTLLATSQERGLKDYNLNWKS